MASNDFVEQHKWNFFVRMNMIHLLRDWWLMADGWGKVSYVLLKTLFFKSFFLLQQNLLKCAIIISFLLRLFTQSSNRSALVNIETTFVQEYACVNNRSKKVLKYCRNVYEFISFVKVNIVRILMDYTSSIINVFVSFRNN